MRASGVSSHKGLLKPALAAVVWLGLVSGPVAVLAQQDHLQCRPFHQIYTNGSQLCENMWDHAFEYSSNTSGAYNFWFFGEDNPNDDVTRRVHGIDNVTDCHLNYFHKDAPSPEGNRMTECHPWKNNACCHSTTVLTPDTLKAAYGAEYHWDRCGPLSEACERFFVMEACFYECEPSAGLYRKYQPGTYNASIPGHNEWQMDKMPIQAAFCDDWYTACYNDLFCGVDGGSYFSCALATASSSPSPSPSLSPEAPNPKDDDDLPTYAWAIIGVLVAVAVAGGSFMTFMIGRERSGKPVFVAHPPSNVQPDIPPVQPTTGL